MCVRVRVHVHVSVCVRACMCARVTAIPDTRSANVSGGETRSEGALGAGAGYGSEEADAGRVWGRGGSGGGGVGGAEESMQKLLLDLKRELREERKVSAK